MLIIIVLLEDKRCYELGSKNIVYIEIKKTDEWNSWNNVIRKRTNKVKNFNQFVNEGKREKIMLGGYETWLDRTGYPAIWLYDSENSKNGIPVDVLYDGKLIGSTELNDNEKKELLNYLNSTR